jgi:[ribosomal protein S18]-alanine N-acetyltransferase
MIAGLPKIRRAEASDLAAILRIEQQTPSASHWSEAEYERILAAELLLVAVTGEAIVGFLCAKQVAGEWTLENIAVAPEWQRQAIARELLTALIVQVRQSAASTVFLEVRESNLAARSFYEEHGFAKVGRRRHYYHSPEEDAVIYCLHASTASSEAPKPTA